MPVDQAEAIRIAEAQSVQMPYLVIAGVGVAGYDFVCRSHACLRSVLKVRRKQVSRAFFRHKHLVLGIIAQFFYVGAQASLWGYFVDLKLHFARTENVGLVQSIYQYTSDMSPTQIASFHASFALAMFMIGRFVGTWLMTRIAANKLLAIYGGASALLTVFAFYESLGCLL